MVVEVARDQQLHRIIFSRGIVVQDVENIGRVQNRRGTSTRFHPDPQIFGATAHFSPGRIFRMTRAKAYLFGGVEIRWFCAPSLIKDDTPAEAVFHFPGGLKEYLEATINGQTRVTKDIFAGRVEKEGGHGSVEWAVCWIADADGLGAFSYQWLRNGAVIVGATGQTHLLDDADVGTLISVRVDWTDLHGTAETLTSAQVGAVANVNDAPVLHPAAPALPDITEDDTAPSGRTVADIVGGSITDADAGAVREAVQAVRDHLAAEVADLLAAQAQLGDAEGAVREVDDGAREGFVERAVGGSEAREAGCGVEGGFESLGVDVLVRRHIS